MAALRDGVHAHQEVLVAAASADFGGRSREETLMLELFPLYDQIRHTRRHLRSWMKHRRVGSVWFLRPSRNYIVHQPLGVAGVIGAWNYQLLLTLGPVVDALAAGNHVMVKPSEIAPRSAEVKGWIVTKPKDHVLYRGRTVRSVVQLYPGPFNELARRWRAFSCPCLAIWQKAAYKVAEPYGDFVTLAPVVPASPDGMGVVQVLDCRGFIVEQYPRNAHANLALAEEY